MQSPPEFSLSDEDRRAILSYARDSVRAAVLRSAPPIAPPQEVFRTCRGVFVTLHVQEKLRGCIGVVEAAEPLSVSIVHCAAGAAQRDPRFSPLRAEELSDLQIEISLLSPPAPILTSQIEIGKHGLIVARGQRRGLLLPQVATEHKLSREQFLAETCRKAGLPENAWQSDEVSIIGFTCAVFSDHSELC
jgi:AmmeMemoRadiSam system protein A